MDAVRQALSNLQGLIDEGFITQQEFNTRRKAIIDGATSLPAGAKPVVGGKAAARKPGATKGSVFDRLGTAPAGGGDSSGSWGHEGFTELYGAGAGKKAGGKAAKGKATKGAPYQPPAMRGAIGKRQVTVVKGGRGGGDLRSKIGGKARGSLPEKCPW